MFDRRDIPPSIRLIICARERDRREDFSQSARYVSRDTPGYADLDQAGRGGPSRLRSGVGAGGVPPGWAPYRYGHWAWIAPWGWTWVDDAPWGYAPFHYGRWVFVGGGWAWVPGPVVVGVRPVYAPALVAWVGGPGFGVASESVPAGGCRLVPAGSARSICAGYRYSPGVHRAGERH